MLCSQSSDTLNGDGSVEESRKHEEPRLDDTDYITVYDGLKNFTGVRSGRVDI